MKYKCELDTETKAVKFYIDDVEVNAIEGSVGYYSYDYHCDDKMHKRENLFASFTTGSDDNRSQQGVSISRDHQGEVVSKMNNSISFGSEIKKAVSSATAALGLYDLFNKKKG